MTAVYAVALVLGIVALIAWTLLSAVAGSADDASRFDPDLRLGSWGRRVIAGLVGLGMGGVSATFAGWPTPLAFIAGIAGGVLLALVSDWLAPRDA